MSGEVTHGDAERDGQDDEDEAKEPSSVYIIKVIVIVIIVVVAAGVVMVVMIITIITALDAASVVVVAAMEVPVEEPVGRALHGKVVVLVALEAADDVVGPVPSDMILAKELDHGHRRVEHVGISWLSSVLDGTPGHAQNLAEGGVGEHLEREVVADGGLVLVVDKVKVVDAGVDERLHGVVAGVGEDPLDVGPGGVASGVVGVERVEGNQVADEGVADHGGTREDVQMLVVG